MNSLLNVAVIDDEITVTNVLKNMLERYASEQEIVINITCFNDPTLFLNDYKKQYDLVLLDIEMPQMNGMDVSKKLRSLDEEVSLFFITNMVQYAIKGYEVNANDFILKPVVYDDFVLKLNRIVKKVSLKNQKTIGIKTNGSIRYLSLQTILYVELFYNHKLLYHTTEGDFEVRGTIKNIEPLFLSSHFLKCNNYCLVNPKYVLGVKDNMVKLGDGKGTANQVSISRSRKKEFLIELNKYLGVNL